MTGTTPLGEPFKLQFHVTSPNSSKGINSITTQQAKEHQPSDAEVHDIALTDILEIKPGQVIELESLLPECMESEIRR